MSAPDLRSDETKYLDAQIAKAVARERAKIEDLTKANAILHALVTNRDAEIERLRAALKRIVAEAESDDGLTAWDGSEIARQALADEQSKEPTP